MNLSPPPDKVEIVVFSGSLPTAVATTEFKEDASLILKSGLLKTVPRYR